MRIPVRRTLLTVTMLLSLGIAAAQTEQTTNQSLDDQATQTSLTLPSGSLDLPFLEGAEPVGGFTTVLGGGVIYRGSVADVVTRYAQALTAAGFTAEGSSAPAADAAGTADASGTAGTDASATTGTTATTDTSSTATAGTATTGTATAGATATTGTTDTSSTATTGTAGTTDTATGDAATTTDTATAGTGTTATTEEGPSGLPSGPVETFVRNGERIQVRSYERGGFTVVVISRLGAAATGTTTSGG